MLEDINVPGSSVAGKFANGAGKTTNILAPAVVWHAVCYPGSRTVTTSGVFRQVKEQMWPRIRELARKFPGLMTVNETNFVVHHRSPNGQTGEEYEARVVGFSTDDPGKFEGWHGTSLMLAFDECKTIPDEIFGASEKCKQGQPTRTIMVSSPGGSKGKFYDAFHKDARFWKLHSATAYECPHVDKRQIEEFIAKWGINHPYVRSQVFAEFMDVGGDRVVITPAQWEQALKSKPVFRGRDKAAFCDFAAGGDENVFAVREGNKILNMTAWNERNTMSAVGRFLQLFRKWGLEPNEVYGDAGGLGIPMCDALAEAGFPVNRVNNGAKAFDSRAFTNRGAEIWFTAARIIEQCDVVDLPPDEVLMAQATTRRTITDSKGRLGVESKEDMSQSPDRADAILGCLASSAFGSHALQNFARPSLLDMLSEQMHHNDLAGFDPGM
jgi:phage terminase large subunit